MAITVILQDHTGNISQEAKLSETAPVEKLIRAIITTLKMPITDAAGRPITYHLSHNDRRLQARETLETAKVQSGDTVAIVPEMTAGSEFEIEDQSFTPPSGCVRAFVCELQLIIGMASLAYFTSC